MDINKTRWSLLDFEFLKDVVEVCKAGMERGSNRAIKGWLDVDSNPESELNYFDAAMRHLIAGVEAKSLKDALWNYASVAANAMILWHHAKWRGGDDE